MRSRILVLALLVILAAEPPVRAQDPQETAALRVLHLSPDAPLVDVVIEGRLHVRDLGLRDRSPFLNVPAGRHEVRVYPHRLPTQDEDSVLPPGEAGPVGPAAPPVEEAPEGQTPSDGAAGEGGEAAAGGDAPADAAAAPAPRVRTLEPVTAVVQLEAGTYTTLVLTGNFELPASDARRGHLSLDVEPPEAEVAVSGPQGYRVQRSGDQLLDDLEPGAYEIEVRLEGFQDAVYNVDVPAGGTAVATVSLQEADEEDGVDQVEPFLQPEEAQGVWRRLELQPYTGEVPLPSPGRALVRFVHVAPIVPQLDVRGGPHPAVAADGDEERDEEGADAPPEARANLLDVDGLAYPNATEYLDVPAGPHMLAFRIAGSDLLLYEVPALDLRPGLTYTLFVAAGPTSGEIWIVPSVDAAVPQRPSAEGAPR